MANTLVRWIIEELFRPLVVFIGSGLEKVYNFFFWEKDVRRSIENENQFASEIQRDLAFLFTTYSAVVVPVESVQPLDVTTHHPRPFDWAFVIVALDDVVLKFFRGSYDLCVWVASKRDLEKWAELPLVLHWHGWRKELGSPRPFTSLQDVAEVLKPRMDQLLEAYSAEGYPQIAQKVSDAQEQERGAARMLSVELNRRLAR